jgi:Asp/Glu/hydantoin racemase
MTGGPRITLIHALQESQAPARAAFAEGWPGARLGNLLDDSLLPDLKAAGDLTPEITGRFQRLARYAVDAGAAGILFTCSAFGPALKAVQASLPIPVLRPNEAAFEAALAAGRRIALVVTVADALPPLRRELDEMAAGRGLAPAITEVVAAGALEALQAGRADDHDRLVAEAVAALTDIDVVVLCQFSLARAAKRLPALPGRQVITTPDCAVAKLRRLVGSGAAPRPAGLSVEDREEIRQLYAAYGWAIDYNGGQGQDWAGCFTEDGVLEIPGRRVVGRRALAAFANETYADTGGLMRHWYTNLLIHPAPFGATGGTYVLTGSAGGGDQPGPGLTITALYRHDELVRTPQGWRFRYRRAEFPV